MALVWEAYEDLGAMGRFTISWRFEGDAGSGGIQPFGCESAVESE